MKKITKAQILNNIDRLEAEGKFNEHAKPIDWSKCNKIDGNYVYLKKGFFYKIAHYFIRGVLAIFRYPINFFAFNLKVKGRENLKGIGNAIVVCNHVHELDCVVAMQAMAGHKLWITVGEFNNKKGLLGALLRTWGTMPLTDSFLANKNLFKATKEILNKPNNYIMYYPEGSLWHLYKKPRPFLNGAFHSAVKNNVPIIPLFIAFNEYGRTKKDGTKKVKATVNILKPSFINPKGTIKEQSEFLKADVYNKYKQFYFDYYGKPLEFSCDNFNG